MSTFEKRSKQCRLSSCRRFLSKSRQTKENLKNDCQALINTGDTSVFYRHYVNSKMHLKHKAMERETFTDCMYERENGRL